MSVIFSAKFKERMRRKRRLDYIRHYRKYYQLSLKTDVRYDWKYIIRRMYVHSHRVEIERQSKLLFVSATLTADIGNVREEFTGYGRTPEDALRNLIALIYIERLRDIQIYI